jgi:hypothetical protein
VKVRNEKFPVTMKCAGSIFKNFLLAELPPAWRPQVPEKVVREGKVPAAYFLEQVGAKGMSRGDIHVAGYHANLIYNAGGGTAADLCALIEELKARVRRSSGGAGRGSAIRGVHRCMPGGVGWLLLCAAALWAADLHEAVTAGNRGTGARAAGCRRGCERARHAGRHRPARRGLDRQPEIAALLIAHGADVNARHLEAGSTPLITP